MTRPRNTRMPRCSWTLRTSVATSRTDAISRRWEAHGWCLLMASVVCVTMTAQCGFIQRYIDEYSVTGLTSNPTIFNNAIKHSPVYTTRIREKFQQGKSGEDLFFDLALEDLKRAADMFAPIHSQTNGVDGWVSLEV